MEKIHNSDIIFDKVTGIAGIRFKSVSDRMEFLLKWS
jgi:hypothetical protein